MNRSSVIATFGLAAAAFALPAAAQMNTGALYAGLSIGQSKFSDACEGSVPAGFTVTCDDKDTAWRIFGGYQFHPNNRGGIGHAHPRPPPANPSRGGPSAPAQGGGAGVRCRG